MNSKRPFNARAVFYSALLFVIVCAGSPCSAEDVHAYLHDLDFIEKTVAERSISLARLRFDWRYVCENSREAFRDCPDDLTHAENVLLLLANLDEAQARVEPHTIPWTELPAPSDGLEAGGLWLEVRDGQVYVRGCAAGHPLAKDIPPGSALVEVEGEPMWLVLERIRRRVAMWFGLTSEHSHWALLGGELLSFGDRKVLHATFLTPGGVFVAAEIPRSDADGRPFQPRVPQDGAEDTALVGVEVGMLSKAWCEKLGVLRLGATIDSKAVEAVDSALESLRGATALIVDLRGCGGTLPGDAAAIAGRFHAAEFGLYRELTIRPRGKWQYDGPIVVLQNGATVEAGEVLLEALIATGRTITIGLPSGGWTLRTERFHCPSKKLSFTLGTASTETLLRESRPYGVGTPPDLEIPVGLAYAATPDLDLELATQILEIWVRQGSREGAGQLFATLFVEADIERFLKAHSVVAAALPGFDAAARAEQARADLGARVAMELALLGEVTATPPDYRAIVRRSRSLLPRLRAAGLTSEATTLSRALRGGLHAEVSAQSALLEVLDSRLNAEPERARKFLRRFDETRVAAYARKALLRAE